MRPFRVLDDLDTAPGRAHWGWIFFDGACGACIAGVHRLGPWLGAAGYRAAPLQHAAIAPRLGHDPRLPPTTMHLVAPDGEHRCGADAWLRLLRDVPWARPLLLPLLLPGIRQALRGAYRWIALRRHRLACPLPRMAA